MRNLRTSRHPLAGEAAAAMGMSCLLCLTMLTVAGSEELRSLSFYPPFKSFNARGETTANNTPQYVQMYGQALWVSQPERCRCVSSCLCLSPCLCLSVWLLSTLQSQPCWNYILPCGGRHTLSMKAPKARALRLYSELSCFYFVVCTDCSSHHSIEQSISGLSKKNIGCSQRWLLFRYGRGRVHGLHPTKPCVFHVFFPRMAVGMDACCIGQYCSRCCINRRGFGRLGCKLSRALKWFGGLGIVGFLPGRFCPGCVLQAIGYQSALYCSVYIIFYPIMKCRRTLYFPISWLFFCLSKSPFLISGSLWATYIYMDSVIHGVFSRNIVIIDDELAVSNLFHKTVTQAGLTKKKQ